MNFKMLNICAVVITLCFVVMAYSQYQFAKAHTLVAEGVDLIAASETVNTISAHANSYSYLHSGYQDARKLGWSLENAFLYGSGSRRANPAVHEEIAEKNKQEAAKREAEKREVEACIKRKNLPADASEAEEGKAYLDCTFPAEE